jgi:hypothetical protein
VTIDQRRPASVLRRMRCAVDAHMTESEVMRSELSSSGAGLETGGATFSGEGDGFGPVAVGAVVHPITATARATTREQRPFAIIYRYV